MPTLSKADLTYEAARIAALWARDGAEAAKQAFQLQCDAWKLRRWEAVVFSDAVHVARAGAACQDSHADEGDASTPADLSSPGDARCDFCGGPMPCYCPPPAGWNADDAMAQDADARDRVSLPHEVHDKI